MILYKSDALLDEHFLPRTPLELWDGSASEQRQALIPNTMLTTLVLFLLWNKNLDVNKLEFESAFLYWARHDCSDLSTKTMFQCQ